MASTTSLLTGLSGLNVHARRLEIIGNNISNINTTAFKSNRVLFAPALSRNLSLGTSPSASSGGTNPGQVGLGVKIAGTQRNFNNGAISRTGVNTDLAIEGNGFFIVERGSESFYTRAGAFQLNAANDLVTISGERVQGLAVDDDFNLIEGQLVDVNIPVGSLTIAQATQNVEFQGNLNANINGITSQGGLLTFGPAFDNIVTGVPMLSTDLLLNNLDDGSGAALFPGGGEPFTYTISGAMKGNKTLPDQTLAIDAATTVQDLLDFYNDAFGIVPGLTNADGATTGAQIDAAGIVTIVTNSGELNNVTFDQTNVSIADMASASIANPFAVAQDPATDLADGESVRTTFIVFDSLGAPVAVDLTVVFESASNTGTTWRYYVDSADNIDPSDINLNVASGTVQFDTDGKLIASGPINITIDRINTGAESPLDFALNFDQGQNSVTALVDGDANAQSVLAATLQDGIPIGTLTVFSVGEDGVLTGAFSNGVTRTIGQIAFATFTNPEGLVDAGDNLFMVGPNSGTPIITKPLQFGTGRVIGSALELSNVDLGEEFTNLILTTTGYSAASRIISTTDQLLQQLVALGR